MSGRQQDRRDGAAIAFDRELVERFGPELGRPLAHLARIRDHATVAHMTMVTSIVVALVKNVDYWTTLEMEAEGQLPPRYLQPVGEPWSPDTAG